MKKTVLSYWITKSIRMLVIIVMYNDNPSRWETYNEISDKNTSMLSILVAVICSMAAILVYERQRIREIEAESAEI